MKGLFDEIADVFSQIQREFEMEAARQKRAQKNQNKSRRQKPSSSQQFKPKDNQQKKTFNGQLKKENINMNEVKTLRDKTSNLENRDAYIEKSSSKRTKLGDYSAKMTLDEQRQEQAKIAMANAQTPTSVQPAESLDSLKKNKHTDRENSDSLIKDIIKSLKTGDKKVSAKKAFIYSEIFNRKY